jgi:tetratricopeptide (TPR) repeat protein
MTPNCRTIIYAVVSAATLFASLPAQAQTGSPQDTLSQYVSNLQKNPNDYALREKIIKHVQSMRPAPAISEEAKRYMARGKAASKGAKEVKDFNEAADEFKKALLAAPWIAEGYYNLGIVQDKAGQYAAAMESLKLYIMSAPNASDVEKVKEMVYEIEYRKEKAAKESSPEAITEKKRQTEEDFIKKLDGVRYIWHYADEYAIFDETIEIRGNRVIKGIIWSWCKRGCSQGTGAWIHEDETTLNGREFSLDHRGGYRCGTDYETKVVKKGKISDDGYSITMESCNKTYIYRRER